MAERLSALGIPDARVRTIANWADGRAIRPVDHAANALRAEWGLGEAFVVAYSGNLGRAHEIETLLKAMYVLETHKAPGCRPTLWLFIGSGALFDALKAEVGRLPRGKEAKPLPLRKEARPFAHPSYWAAFVLLGDPR